METAIRTDRISVCICTFKRPVQLAALLERLSAQCSEPAFSFDVVVVDNDRDRSAEPIVRAFADRYPEPAVVFDCEAERNISLARNRAIRSATGNLVAFIDDDERPEPDWLQRLHASLMRHAADGVLGPVVPDFPPESPAWLKRGRVFHRRRYTTGTPIQDGDGRTGNALLKRQLFSEREPWFDPALGRSGGEDSDFFTRQRRLGRVFVWCDEAVVHEDVPKERWSRSFHIKRLWRSGTVSGEWIRQGRLPTTLVLKNLLGLGAYAAVAPVSLVMPQHVQIRVAQKLAYCAGVLTAYVGLPLFRDRE
jgi:succinoglycan biosynthesis protein ExoM